MAAFSFSAVAETNISMNFVSAEGIDESVGTISVKQTEYGLVFTPNLTGLKPGLRGFHLHTNGSCMPKEKNGKMVPALAAGGHYDPEGTNTHGSPWGGGHLGDLPALYVDAAGNVTQPVLAPRLKMSDLKNRAIMIHAGADNHSDHPKKLGGGGPRDVCGVSS